MTLASKKWSNFYINSQEKSLAFPAEPLVRMMKGSYIPSIDKNYRGKKALDVGFGHGDNLILLAHLGLDLYGVEIEEEICASTKKKVEEMGLSCELRHGHNRSIPFDDNFFDVLVSWATLHYEKNLKDYNSALQEFCRVLKPGGRLFVETVHPNHSILNGSVAVEPHVRELHREDDFRNGDTFFCLEDPIYAKAYYGEFFNDVLVGYGENTLFTDTIATYYITCVK